MKLEDGMNAELINESLKKHFDEESEKFLKESEVHFEVCDLMDSLQGWCLNKMLHAKSAPSRELLQALNNWADEKPFLQD